MHIGVSSALRTIVFEGTKSNDQQNPAILRTSAYLPSARDNKTDAFSLDHIFFGTVTCLCQFKAESQLSFVPRNSGASLKMPEVNPQGMISGLILQEVNGSLTTIV